MAQTPPPLPTADFEQAKEYLGLFKEKGFYISPTEENAGERVSEMVLMIARLGSNKARYGELSKQSHEALVSIFRGIEELRNTSKDATPARAVCKAIDEKIVLSRDVGVLYKVYEAGLINSYVGQKLPLIIKAKGAGSIDLVAEKLEKDIALRGLAHPTDGARRPGSPAKESSHGKPPPLPIQNL